MDLGAITEDGAQAAAQLLALSFDEDPAFVWWFPDPALRSELAPHLFTAHVRLALALGDGLLTATGDGAALYLPPGTQITEDDLVRSGLTDLLGRVGSETADRITRFLATLSRLHTTSMPEPHWQLLFLGVHPAARGHGTGAALVDEVNARATRDGVGVYLETLTPAGVAFYEHRGYRVIGEAEVPGSDLHVRGLRFD
jgi:ribosomal protein S18 acetylase RimI-like enzyme